MDDMSRQRLANHSGNFTLIQQFLLRQTCNTDNRIRWSMPIRLIVHKFDPDISPATIYYILSILLRVAGLLDDIMSNMHLITSKLVAWPTLP